MRRKSGRAGLQNRPRLRKPHAKQGIEIRRAILRNHVGSDEEDLQNKQVQLLHKGGVIGGCQEALHILTEIMPFGDIFLIFGKLRNSEPFADPDFYFAGHVAAVVHDKIAEGAGICIIIAAKREQPAQSRAERMNGAASVAGKERTGTVFSVLHPEVRENHAFLLVKSKDACGAKLFKTLSEAGGELINVPGIQMNGVCHAVAAVSAAVAFLAVHLCQIGVLKIFVIHR